MKKAEDIDDNAFCPLTDLNTSPNPNQNGKTSEISIEPTDESLERLENRLKLIIIGDYGIGKTSFVSKFIFKHKPRGILAMPTVVHTREETEFSTKNYKINNEVYKIELWDTADQEKNGVMPNTFFKGAHGAIIMYDLTNKTSFDNVNKWVGEIRDHTDKNIALMILANKVDLGDSIVITKDQAKNKSKDLNISFMTISVNNDTNLHEAFHRILKRMYKASLHEDPAMIEIRKKTVKIEPPAKNDQAQKKKNCC